MSSTYTDLQYTTFPDQIQNFVTMLNIVTEDAPLITGYQNAMRSGDFTLAQNYFNQITNGNQKLLDAVKLNTLMDTCIAIQRFYTSDIAPYINNLHAEWTEEIEKFSYQGDYDPTQLYYKNNFVKETINGVDLVFICTNDAPVGTYVTDTNYWRQLTIQGIQGVSGTGMSFRFGWDSAETYYVNDVVTYQDGIWNCLIENTNQSPYDGSTYWQLIHSMEQDIYPFSSTQPSSQQSGDLWFEIL